jgi:peptidoglycan hydrolase CwlO-like protein
VLEHSAQCLSNIHDEHKSLKVRLETVANNIETTKTVNKDVKNRLMDVETQIIRQNLLFFAIDEQPDNTGMQREIHDENCSNIVFEFYENRKRQSEHSNRESVPELQDRDQLW